VKILLTGASGFLGGIFYVSWKDVHQVYTLGRNSGASFQFDLRGTISPLPRFDLVVHTAGKAHITPRNPDEAQEFYDINVKGTINLLKALETNLPETFVLISSVAVYGLHTGSDIDETYPLLATDPYGKSKIEAEQIVTEWGRKTGVNTLILRLPLIAGPNPPGNLGAMIRAINGGYYFRIGKGSALRSIVNATDVAGFIPKMMNVRGIFNLTALRHPSVSEIDSLLGQLLNKKIRKLPASVIQLVAFAGDIIPGFPINSVMFHKLTDSLTFSSQLAATTIGWKPDDVSLNAFMKKL